MSDETLQAVREAAAGKYEVLGEMGHNPDRTAFLAWDLASGEFRVLLLQETGPNSGELETLAQLDASVPRSGVDCRACGAPLTSWAGFCGTCGADVSGLRSDEALAGMSPEEQLDFVQEAVADAYEVLGTMHRGGGEGDVFITRERSDGRLVAFQLEEEQGALALVRAWSMEAAGSFPSALETPDFATVDTVPEDPAAADPEERWTTVPPADGEWEPIGWPADAPPEEAEPFPTGPDPEPEVERGAPEPEPSVARKLDREDARTPTETVPVSVDASGSLPQRMIRAALLNGATYDEVEADTGATGQAALVVGLVGAALAVGTGGGIGGAVVAVVGCYLAWALWSGVTYLIGGKLLGGTTDFGELLRTLGFALSPGVLFLLLAVVQIRPVVSLAVTLWVVVAGVVAIQRALDVGMGKAVGTALLGGIIVLAPLVALGALSREPAVEPTDPVAEVLDSLPAAPVDPAPTDPSADATTPPRGATSRAGTQERAPASGPAAPEQRAQGGQAPTPRPTVARGVAFFAGSWSLVSPEAFAAHDGAPGRVPARLASAGAQTAAAGQLTVRGDGSYEWRDAGGLARGAWRALTPAELRAEYPDPPETGILLLAARDGDDWMVRQHPSPCDDPAAARLCSAWSSQMGRADLVEVKNREWGTYLLGYRAR